MTLWLNEQTIERQLGGRVNVTKIESDSVGEVCFRIEPVDGTEFISTHIQSFGRYMADMRRAYLRYDDGQLYLYGPEEAYVAEEDL